jgi:hypothetical protein
MRTSDGNSDISIGRVDADQSTARPNDRANHSCPRHRRDWAIASEEAGTSLASDLH